VFFVVLLSFPDNEHIFSERHVHRKNETQEADVMQDRNMDQESMNEEYLSDFDYNDEDEEEENEPENAPRGGLKLLTVIQISVSVAILVAALALRVLGGELFQKVRAWYVDAVNDTIIADEQIDQAKRTVVELWNNIAAAGPRTAVGSESGTATSAAGTGSAQNGNSSAGAQSSASQVDSAAGAQSSTSQADSQADAQSGASQAQTSAGESE
jgi:hypothetical protein